jgi:hypothetical protein
MIREGVAIAELTPEAVLAMNGLGRKMTLSFALWRETP